MQKATALRFRPLTDADAEMAAAMVTRDQPRRPMSLEHLRERFRNAETSSEVRRFQVESGGEPLGWLSVLRLRGKTEEHALVNQILPGVARSTYDQTGAFAIQNAKEMGATFAVAEIWEDNAELIASLRGMGWEQIRRQRYWRLELPLNAERLHSQLASSLKRVTAAGVRIASAAELGGPAIYPKLYEVNQAAHADIPTTVPFELDPYETWIGWMQPPGVLAERVWVAAVEGRPVGFSFLTYRPDIVDTGFTGVLREHRGQGIARALKLETVCQAAELGVTAVETDNDSENAPILHLNEEIGYQEVEGQLQLRKSL